MHRNILFLSWTQTRLIHVCSHGRTDVSNTSLKSKRLLWQKTHLCTTRLPTGTNSLCHNAHKLWIKAEVLCGKCYWVGACINYWKAYRVWIEGLELTVIVNWQWSCSCPSSQVQRSRSCPSSQGHRSCFGAPSQLHRSPVHLKQVGN